MKLDDGGYRNKNLRSLENMMTNSKRLLCFVNNHWTITSIYFYQFRIDKQLFYRQAMGSFQPARSIFEMGTEQLC